MTAKKKTIMMLKGLGFCQDCRFKGKLDDVMSNIHCSVCMQEVNEPYEPKRFTCDHWYKGSGSVISGQIDIDNRSGKLVFTADQDFLAEHLGQTIARNVKIAIPEKEGVAMYFLKIEPHNVP